MSEGIANADVSEIEVTPEMIEAGAFLLCGFQTTTLDEEHWAEAVYRAMAAVAFRVPPPPPL